MKFYKIAFFYTFLLLSSFSFFSCDFIKSIFVPPIDPPDKTDVTVPLVDQFNRRTAIDLVSGTTLTLKVNTDIQYTLDDITWSSEGPVTIYTGLRDAIANITGSGNGKVTCTIKSGDKVAYGEYVFSSKNGSSDSVVTVSSGTITSINPEFSNISIDIGQLKNVKINNNVNASNVKYIAVSNNDNVIVFSGIDYIAIKGNKSGTSIVSVYNENKSVMCSINVTISSNIYTPPSSTTNISANYDVIKLNVGQQTIVTTNINVSAYSSDTKIFNILYSDGNKHVIKCDNVGISSIIFVNLDNPSDILSIPVIVSNPNSNYDSSNAIFSVYNTYYELAINQKVFIPIKNISTLEGISVFFDPFFLNIYKNSSGIIIEGKNSGNTEMTISNNSNSITINVFINSNTYTQNNKPADKYFNSNDSYVLKTNSLCYIEYTTNDDVCFFFDDNLASIYTYTNNIIVVKTTAPGVTHLKVYNKNMEYLLKDILITISENGSQSVSDVVTTDFKTLSISPVNSSVRKNETLYFNVTNNVASSYVWGVSNPDIADIVISNNNYVKILGKNVGDTYITCATADGKYTASTILTVVPVTTEYTTNDYIGLNGNTSINMSVGDTYTYNISTIPEQINGQIEMKYVIDDPSLLEIKSHNNMACSIKALKSGITTLLVGDINNKYKKYVNVVIKEVGDTSSPSFISLIKDYYVMQIGDTEKVSVSIVPAPQGIYKPETATTFSYSDPTAFNIVGNYGTTSFTALRSGEYTLEIRNPYANNSPYNVKIFVKASNEYLGFSTNVLNGIVNKTGSITASLTGVPPNVQLQDNDFIWDVVDANNQVLNNPCIKITYKSLYAITFSGVYASSEQYLRIRYKDLSARIILNILEDNYMTVVNNAVSIEPVNTFTIPINDISPLSCTPLIYIDDVNGSFNATVVKDTNNVSTGIKITPLNKKESSDSASITIMHPINKKIFYKVPVRIKWNRYFNLDTSYGNVNSSAIYDSSKFANEKYDDETNTRPLIVKYVLSPPTSNIQFLGDAAFNYYNVTNITYNEDTRTGYFVVYPKSYTSNVYNLSIKSSDPNTTLTLPLKQNISSDIKFDTYISASSHNFGRSVGTTYNEFITNFERIWDQGYHTDDITLSIIYKPYIYVNNNKQYINATTIGANTIVNGVSAFDKRNSNSYYAIPTATIDPNGINITFKFYARDNRVENLGINWDGSGNDNQYVGFVYKHIVTITMGISSYNIQFYVENRKYDCGGKDSIFSSNWVEGGLSY